MSRSCDDDRVSSAAFSPDGARVVTASWDKTARLWDAATGKEAAVLRGHDDRVLSAAFSPDGARVVTASKDKTARLWDAATGKEAAVLRGHDDAVMSAALSPAGGASRVSACETRWNGERRGDRVRKSLYAAALPAALQWNPASVVKSAMQQ